MTIMLQSILKHSLNQEQDKSTDIEQQPPQIYLEHMLHIYT